MTENQTRRRFLQTAAATAGLTLANGSGCLSQEGKGMKMEAGGKKPARLKLALASYTTRKFNLEKTLEITRRVGLDYICLKSFHLPLDASEEQIKQAIAQIKEAGVTPYGAGVVDMKNPQQIEQAFNYAKTAGFSVLVAVPEPKLLGLVEEKVKQYDIKVAIHNHGPQDKIYPTPESAYQKIKELDKRIGLCIDIGHTIRAGVDPAQAAQKYADRLIDVHIKDISSANAAGKTVEAGRGVINIPHFLQTMIDIGYDGKLAFEYEKDENDPLPGLAESVGYTRGVLAAI